MIRRNRPYVTPPQIEQVVAAFYAAARSDPVLGPVFGKHVVDWPSHEAKIARFWRNALLGERVYHDNPMRTHLDVGDVVPDHFVRWLDLFDHALRDTLPETEVQTWSRLAHRIGDGLRFGLEASKDGIPKL